MRNLSVLLLLALAGCRYETVQDPGRSSTEVWRLDRFTGTIARCILVKGHVQCFD